MASCTLVMKNVAQNLQSRKSRWRVLRRNTRRSCVIFNQIQITLDDEQLQAFKKKVKEVEEKVNEAAKLVDLEQSDIRLQELQKQSEEPGLWDDPDNAQKLMQQINDIKEEINVIKQFQQQLDDAVFTLDLLQEEQGEEAAQLLNEGDITVNQLLKKLDKWQTKQHDQPHTRS
eukprot:TRINITY_DN104899_c0_g1_i1.p3 TRINITY_DN104899_c0_g1~~TRINITY_DN104899_c0_g1_i1.p3  ORF type:complete len:173 (+),score=35.24 TRINITY_DN104899_c0_g1_i1:108-626(+)